MQENLRGEDRWVRCPNCGHKLFRVMSLRPITAEVVSDMTCKIGDEDGALETKCHSCKKIVEIRLFQS